jgi:hypothetical protein
LCMSVKSPLGLVLYCYLNMPTIDKTYLILSDLKYKNSYHLGCWPFLGPFDTFYRGSQELGEMCICMKNTDNKFYKESKRKKHS